MTFYFYSHGTDPGSRHCGQAWLRRDEHGWWLMEHQSIAPRKGESADDRMSRILSGYNLLQIHCYSYELQTGGSIGGQAAGKWNAGNLSVHEVVGAIRMAAHVRRVPCLGLTTSSIVKAVTGSGVIRGGVNYEALERALRAQVRGIPKRVSQHVLMAIAVAIAGARAPGSVDIRRSTVVGAVEEERPRLAGTDCVRSGGIGERAQRERRGRKSV